MSPQREPGQAQTAWRVGAGAGEEQYKEGVRVYDAHVGFFDVLFDFG